MPKQQLERDLIVITQLQSFFDRYYRFPSFVKVGNERVLKDEVILTVERHLNGTTFEWYKRKRFRIQTSVAVTAVRHKLEAVA